MSRDIIILTLLATISEVIFMQLIIVISNKIMGLIEYLKYSWGHVKFPYKFHINLANFF